MKTTFTKIYQTFSNWWTVIRFGLTYGPAGVRLLRKLKEFPGVEDSETLRVWFRELNSILSEIALKTENVIDDGIVYVIDAYILANDVTWKLIYQFLTDGPSWSSVGFEYWLKNAEHDSKADLNEVIETAGILSRLVKIAKKIKGAK